MPDNEIPYFERWYEVVQDNSLRQGDVFRDLIVFWHPQSVTIPEGLTKQDELKLPLEWIKGDWIVLTASCDVIRKSASQALICPVREAALKTLKAQTDKELKERIEVMRRGGYPTKFLLPEYPKIDPPFSLSYVEYTHYLTVPTSYLERSAVGSRLRLLHPFREMFGRWAGECLARIGPEDAWLMPRLIQQLHDAQRLKAEIEPEPAPAGQPDARRPVESKRPWWRFW